MNSFRIAEYLKYFSIGKVQKQKRFIIRDLNIFDFQYEF